MLQLTKRNLLAFLAGGIVFVVFIAHLGRGPSAAATILDQINNSTLGFEDIFVVSLPTRSDRRDGMVLQAALTDFRLNFVDGILGQDVVDKAIPTKSKHDRMGDAPLGCWRGHMNALQEIVRRNLSSALIMEDDADWDVRLKKQLRDFAISTQALTQPLQSDPNAYADQSFPHPGDSAPQHPVQLDFNNLPLTEAPTISPYGDDWDMLWLGHCGVTFPSDGHKVLSQGRVVQPNDETVAGRKYLWSLANPFRLKDEYPEHTRVVHHAQEGVCAMAYAVSQRGARKLLNEVGLKDMTDAFDILLRFACEGMKGRRKMTCLATQPPLFSHFGAAGPMSAASDIGNHQGFREHDASDFMRWSVRLNVENILDGKTDMYDQLPGE